MVFLYSWFMEILKHNTELMECLTSRYYFLSGNPSTTLLAVVMTTAIRRPYLWLEGLWVRTSWLQYGILLPNTSILCRRKVWNLGFDLELMCNKLKQKSNFTRTNFNSFEKCLLHIRHSNVLVTNYLACMKHAWREVNVTL